MISPYDPYGVGATDVLLKPNKIMQKFKIKQKIQIWSYKDYSLKLEYMN